MGGDRKESRWIDLRSAVGPAWGTAAHDTSRRVSPSCSLWQLLSVYHTSGSTWEGGGIMWWRRRRRRRNENKGVRMEEGCRDGGTREREKKSGEREANNEERKVGTFGLARASADGLCSPDVQCRHFLHT
ncbi:hypothetical protein INR49_024007 [Caranx melampygus]|nr:hypothetical protein INR49_024007 [Caranx melampygus]